MKNIIDFILSNSFMIAQVMGIVVTVLSVIAMQIKDMKNILIGGAIINTLTTMQMALLGGFSGAGTCLTATVQCTYNYGYTQKTKKATPPKSISAIFILIYIIVNVAVYKGPQDLISIFAAVLYGLAVIQENPAIFRVLLQTNSFAWLIYQLAIGGYTMVVTYVILITSTFIAMWRLDRGFWKDVLTRKQKQG